MLCWAMTAVLQAGPPARSAALARREPASPQAEGSLHTGITCASLGCTSLTCNNDDNCPHAGTDPDDHACVGATPPGGQAGAGAAGWWRQRRRRRRRESRSPRAHEHDGSTLDIHPAQESGAWQVLQARGMPGCVTTHAAEPPAVHVPRERGGACLHRRQSWAVQHTCRLEPISKCTVAGGCLQGRRRGVH